MYGFCHGKARLCYIYLATKRMDGGWGGDRFVDIIVKTLGEDVDCEDGVEEGGPSTKVDCKIVEAAEKLLHKKDWEGGCCGEC